MPIVHLIHGFLGSGKTTFALRLAQETGALRFSPDERMAQRHGDDPSAEYFNDYLAIIMAGLSAEWPSTIQSGRDAILDYGFWTRAERDAARQTATSLGATIQLYALHCPEPTARQRIRLRNTDLRGSLIVTDATYDFLRPRFEPLQPDEPHFRIESAS